MLSTSADKSWTVLHVTGNKILFLLDSGHNFSALTILPVWTFSPWSSSLVLTVNQIRLIYILFTVYARLKSFHLFFSYLSSFPILIPGRDVIFTFQPHAFNFLWDPRNCNSTLNTKSLVTLWSRDIWNLTDPESPNMCLLRYRYCYLWVVTGHLSQFLLRTPKMFL